MDIKYILDNPNEPTDSIHIRTVQYKEWFEKQNKVIKNGVIMYNVNNVYLYARDMYLHWYQNVYNL